MTVAASVDDDMQPALRSEGTQHAVSARHTTWICCEDGRQGCHRDQVEASMELTLALPTGPAHLQQVDRRTVVLRRGVGNQGVPAPRRPRLGNHGVSGARESIRPSSFIAPLNTGRFRRRSDGSILALGTPKTSCTASWMACRRGEQIIFPFEEV